MSTKSYRPWAPDQPYLLPPSPHEWLPENHLALFLLRVVDRLDLSAIHAAHAAKDPRGERPYSPEMLVALLLYAYCTGTFSSRKIERATYEDVGFRVIAGGNHPDHVTIARFRKQFFDVLATLFVQVVQLCKELGVANPERVAVDGTRMQANASKHKAMSYERMASKRRRLQEEIQQLLEHADEVDAEEDATHGKDHNGLLRQVPDELKRRKDQIDAIETAMAELERGARDARAEKLEELASGNDERAEDEDQPSRGRKAAATRAERQRRKAQELRRANDEASDDDDRHDDDDDTDGPTLPLTSEDSDEPDEEGDARTDDEDDDGEALPERRTRHTAAGEPHPKAQRNFTDPDSAIMEHKGGFVQGYNCQIATTNEQIIVGQGTTNVAPDTHHLRPLIERVRRHCGDEVDELLADAGYWAPDNDSFCQDKGIDAYISTSREAKAKSTASTGTDPPTTARERMQRKLATEEGRATYSKRKGNVEPVFGQIKEAMGFRRFSVRGIDLVRAEWALVCACHNLRKLWRLEPGLGLKPKLA